MRVFVSNGEGHIPVRGSRLSLIGGIIEIKGKEGKRNSGDAGVQRVRERER